MLNGAIVGIGKIIKSKGKGPNILLAENGESNLEISPVPTKYELGQNYPNPFNPSTQIQFALPKESRVKLEIYNTLGERITTLADETRQAGYYSERFDAAGLASGLYFYRLQAGEFVDTKRLLLLK